MVTKQPQVANEVALAKVAEIDADIAALDKIILEAKTRRENFLAVRKALEPLVTEQQQQQQQLETSRSPLVLIASKSVPYKADLLAGLQDLQSGNVNTGFRDAVRYALREAAPKGLKPGELIKVLQDRGDFSRYTGKGRPQDRVYSELHSLKNSKEITKRYGRYVITSVEATNA